MDAVEAEKKNLKSCNENRAVVHTHLGSPPEREMNFFSTKSPEFGSSRPVMDCRNLLLSRNCRETVKFAVVRITELRRRDDPDKILEVCLRHNLSHNPINVARLTVAG